MSQLIVDFPRNLRPMLESRPSKLMLSTTTPARRSVRFSETSVLIVTDRATKEELQHRWYSKAERSYLRADFSRHVSATRYKLSTVPTTLIGQEDLYDCVGMERFLSQEVYIHTVERRRQHLRTILAAQNRLRLLNMPNDEHLSRISERNSEWTITRARNIANQYWTTLKI